MSKQWKPDTVAYSFCRPSLRVRNFWLCQNLRGLWGLLAQRAKEEWKSGNNLVAQGSLDCRQVVFAFLEEGMTFFLLSFLSFFSLPFSSN